MSSRDDISHLKSRVFGTALQRVSKATTARRFRNPSRTKSLAGSPWADLKDSDKVGSYPYPKNKPDKYPYWDNLGADWLYGGIYVYGEYPDDDDLESANVYVEDEPYD